MNNVVGNNDFLTPDGEVIPGKGIQISVQVTVRGRNGDFSSITTYSLRASVVSQIVRI